MPNFINQKMLEEYTQAFAGVESCFMVSLAGMTVEEINNLRAAFSEFNLPCRVVKNRIAQRALEANGIKGLEEILAGPVALVYGDAESAIQAAKVVVNIMKDSEALQVKGAYLDGQVLGADEAKGLSKVPGKMELYSMILGGLNNLLSAPAALTNQVVAQPAMLASAYEEKLT